MPSTISRPSEPVDTVSTSIAAMFLPSRMIEPLPKLRSICESAASRAFDLSMDDPSTRRSAALIGRAPYGRDSEGAAATDPFWTPFGPFGPASAPFTRWRLRLRQCTRSVLRSQYVLGSFLVLAPFHTPWPLLIGKDFCDYDPIGNKCQKSRKWHRCSCLDCDSCMGINGRKMATQIRI